MTNYTKQDYERDVKILADAPEGATHVEIFANMEPYFYKREKKAWAGHIFMYDWWGGDNLQWLHSSKVPMGDKRKLSDIRTIVAMYKELNHE